MVFVRMMQFISMTFLVCANFAYAEPEGLRPRVGGAIEILKTKCIEFSGVEVGDASEDIADCQVSEFGSLGTFRNQTYHYAIYCLIPRYSVGDGTCASNTFNAQYHRARAMAVFVGDEKTNTTQLLLERAEPEVGMVWYEKPEIVTNALGTFLYVPIRLDGTGDGNLSQYYLWEDKTAEWQSVEAKSWSRSLNIPSGLSINKGIWLDLKAMSANAYLYRANDANCCPTGGTAVIELTIENGHFAVKSLTLNLEENTKR